MKGTLSNVVYTPLQAKSNPIAFNCWVDDLGTKWVLVGDAVSPDLIASKIAQSLFNNSLVSASQHLIAKGMQDGLGVNTFRHIINKKSKHQAAYRYVAALEMIMAGACWPAGRVHAIKPWVPNLCSRCHAHEEGSLHTFWTCPHTANIEESAVQDSQYLVHKAITASDADPCLWFPC